MAIGTASATGARRGAAWGAGGVVLVLALVVAMSIAPARRAAAPQPLVPDHPSGLPVRSLPMAAEVALAASASAAGPRRLAPRARVDDPPAPVASAPASKWARVSALVATGKPADAFAAYAILSLCATVQGLQQARDDGGDPAQRADRSRLDDQCGDLSPGQIGDRVRLLEAAADAHVPGAVAALLDQGPDGQTLADVWDDPAFADWRRGTQQRVEAEALRGDAVALQLMVGQHDQGQRPLGAEDAAAALKFNTAYVDVRLATDPAYASPTRREALRMLAARLQALYAGFLTPEQVDAALADGHALVAPLVAAAPATAPPTP